MGQNDSRQTHACMLALMQTYMYVNNVQYTPQTLIPNVQIASFSPIASYSSLRLR